MNNRMWWKDDYQYWLEDLKGNSYNVLHALFKQLYPEPEDECIVGTVVTAVVISTIHLIRTVTWDPVILIPWICVQSRNKTLP